MIAGGRKWLEPGAPEALEHRPEGLKLTIVKPASGWLSIDWAELFAHRDLLFFLVWRDLKVRYQQTILGATWAILQPLLTVGIFSLVFGRLASMPSNGLPYPLFCFSGLVIWNFFMQGVVNATSSVVGSQQLVQKVHFPRLIIPLSTILAGLVDFGITFIFLLLVMLAYGVVPGPYILVAMPLLGVTLAAALGVGAMLAAFNVRFRDVRHITGVLAQIWLFATPIVYPASLVPEQWRTLIAINPMVGMVEGFRWSLLRTGPFPWELVAVSTASALLLLFAGLFIFRRMESSFADVI